MTCPQDRQAQNAPEAASPGAAKPKRTRAAPPPVNPQREAASAGYRSRVVLSRRVPDMVVRGEKAQRVVLSGLVPSEVDRAATPRRMAESNRARVGHRLCVVLSRRVPDMVVRGEKAQRVVLSGLVRSEVDRGGNPPGVGRRGAARAPEGRGARDQEAVVPRGRASRELARASGSDAHPRRSM